MADTLRVNPGAAGRRRTLARVGPGTNLLHASRLRSIVKGDGSDAIPESNRSSHFKLENSYRMTPEQDNSKFQPWRVEKLMREVLEERLGKSTYDPTSCQLLAKELATEIQKRVKDFRWQRYKIVCHVTLGEQKNQGLQVASRCIWDQSLDSHASVTYDNKSIFAVAQCYGVYYE